MAVKKNRVVFIPNTLETFGGGERWTLEVATGLKGQHDITILNPLSPNSIIRLTQKKIADEYKLGGIKVEDLECFGIKSVAFGTEPFILMLPSVGGILEMRHEIRDADIVYQLSLNPFLLFYSILFSKIYSKKLVFGVHNPTFFKLFAGDSGPFQQLLNFFYVVLLRNVRYFHVLNAHDENLVKANFSGPIVYKIPDFVRPVKTRLKANKDRFVVLFVGRLEENQKGLDILYKIVNKVLEDNNKIVFHIAGDDGTGKHIVEKLSKEHPGKVKMLGFVGNRLLESEYANSSLFIMPSRFESFGLSLLEAQSYGLPAIAFDIDPIRGILREGYQGRLIGEFDYVKFSDAIIEYYDLWKAKKLDLKLKNRISKNIVARYGKGAIIMQLARIFNSKE